MTIAQIVANGRGTAHAWRVIRDDPADPFVGNVATLWHYSTPMLRWKLTDPRVLDYATGWGSVSDQNGLNTAFRMLGLSLRYDRDVRGGGPRITALCSCPAVPYVHDSRRLRLVRRQPPQHESPAPRGALSLAAFPVGHVAGSRTASLWPLPARLTRRAVRAGGDPCPISQTGSFSPRAAPRLVPNQFNRPSGDRLPHRVPRWALSADLTALRGCDHSKSEPP